MSKLVAREKSRLIVALDVETVQEAIVLMDSVKDHVFMVKIGYELIVAQLAGLVATEASKRGLGVFLDPKVHDIPPTVERAVRAALANIDAVQMINVHASAGIPALAGAVKAAGSRVLVLGVTVLTSFDEETTLDIYGEFRDAKVLDFAKKVAKAGAKGVVCSAKELKTICGNEETRHLVPVVPGTRTFGGSVTGQANVITAHDAILHGAQWLVIGRELSELSPEARGERAMALNQVVAEALLEREAVGS